MESELSDIFRVKLVTKNIVRESPGTQFMHMSVKGNACFSIRNELYFLRLLLKIYKTFLYRLPHNLSYSYFYMIKCPNC